MVSHWPKVRIESVRATVPDQIAVGSEVQVTAIVELAALSPEDVTVEIYHGPLDNDRQIVGGTATPMAVQNPQQEYATPQAPLAAAHSTSATFVGTIPCTVTGQYGYAIRVVPHHTDMVSNYDLRLITWG